MRTTLKAGLYAIFLSLILSACGGEGERSSESTLNRGLASEPDSFDQHRNTSTQGHRVLIDLFEGLLRYSADGTLEGGVAREWSVSDDGLVYTFILDESARWSNGDPVTAHDFVFSLRRLVNPKTAAFYAQFLSTIENAETIIAGKAEVEELGVAADDDHTLVIRLSKPTVYFPQLLTHPATTPIHEGSIKEHGDEFTREGNLVSNGAYKLDSRVMGSIVTLSKNEFYRESDKVRIDTVNYIVLVDGTAMYNMYRAGDLHITGTVSMSAFRGMKEDRPDELKVAPLLGVYYYGFNMTREPFASNPKLRAALSMAIDRDILVEAVTGRGELPAYSWVPPGIEGYTSPQFTFTSMSKEEREDMARQLYEEAGFNEENPARFELRYNVGEGEQTVALAIQSMWLNVLGAEAELVNEEFKVLISNIMQKKITEAFRLSWIGDYFDPKTFLQLMETDHPQNLTGYSNTKYDRLMAEASVELDSTRRMSLMEEAESLMLTEHPAIPLYFYVSKHLVKNEVKGWKNTTIDFHPSQFLWLEENGP